MHFLMEPKLGELFCFTHIVYDGHKIAYTVRKVHLNSCELFTFKVHATVSNELGKTKHISCLNIQNNGSRYEECVCRS